MGENNPPPIAKFVHATNRHVDAESSEWLSMMAPGIIGLICSDISRDLLLAVEVGCPALNVCSVGR